MWILKIELSPPGYDDCGDYLELYFHDKETAMEVGNLIGPPIFDDDRYVFFETPNRETNISAQLFEQEIFDSARDATSQFYLSLFPTASKLSKRLLYALDNS